MSRILHKSMMMWQQGQSGIAWLPTLLCASPVHPYEAVWTLRHPAGTHFEAELCIYPTGHHKLQLCQGT